MQRVCSKLCSPDQPALVIYDVFRGHIASEVDELLEEKKLLKVTVSSNCTDRLQPIDLSGNKAVKDHLRSAFQEWYVNEVTKQHLPGKSPEDVRVDMRLSVLKELQAKVDCLHIDYLSANPQIACRKWF